MVSKLCQRPDRDVPKVTCGYPLPCPYHTAIIDLEKDVVTIPVLVGGKAALRVLEIANKVRK